MIEEVVVRARPRCGGCGRRIPADQWANHKVICEQRDESVVMYIKVGGGFLYEPVTFHIFDCCYTDLETGKPWCHPARPRQFAAVIIKLPTLADRRAALALLEYDWDLLAQVETWIRYFWERRRLQRLSLQL